MLLKYLSWLMLYIYADDVGVHFVDFVVDVFVVVAVVVDVVAVVFLR